MKKRIVSRSEADTSAAAAALAAVMEKGDILVMEGDLGAGKTVFVKAACRALECPEEALSPTFTIVREYYGGRLPVYHFDFYRIEDEREMDELGLEEYFYGSGVCFLEWGKIAESLLPEDCLHLAVNVVSDTERELVFTSRGRRSEKLLEDAEIEDTCD